MAVVAVTVKILPVESDAEVQVTATVYSLRVLEHVTAGVLVAPKMALSDVIVTVFAPELPTRVVYRVKPTVSLPGATPVVFVVTSALFKYGVKAAFMMVYP